MCRSTMPGDRMTSPLFSYRYDIYQKNEHRGKAGCRWRSRLGFVRAFAAAVLALVGAFGLIASAQDGRISVVLSLDGIMGPATADYVTRGIRRAAKREAANIPMTNSISQPTGIEKGEPGNIHTTPTDGKFCNETAERTDAIRL
jgi:hypothetical protein